MNNVHSSKRLNVIVGGRVQGVGFRYTTNEIARSFSVTGFVRNKRDGTVEIMMEGSEQELINFYNEIRGSRIGKYITSQQLNWSDATGEYHTFGILTE